MKVEKIAGYSSDYKDYLYCTGTYYCTVPIDFDFAINCPDMENRVYYKKRDSDSIKERLNQLGVFLLFWYDLKSREVTRITVKYDAGCMVEYQRQQDIEKITNDLIAWKDEGEKQGSGNIKQKEPVQNEQCNGTSF